MNGSRIMYVRMFVSNMPAFKTTHVSSTDVWLARGLAAVLFVMNFWTQMISEPPEDQLQLVAGAGGMLVGCYIIYFLLVRGSDRYYGWKIKRKNPSS